MKKTLTIIAIFALVAALSAGIFAAETPKFVISTITADPGATVSVTISIVNNPGIASARLIVKFDDALTLESITYGSNLGGMTQQPQKLASPVILNWISALAELKTDEIYATLVFRVSGDAAGGNHPITVTYDENDVYNIHEDNVYFEVVNGDVYVDRPSEPTTASTTEATTAATVATSTTVETTTATTETTVQTAPSQTNATYPTATTAETSISVSTSAGTSAQQTTSTTETTLAESRPVETTIASTASEMTTASQNEPTQAVSTADRSSEPVPTESVAETAATQPSESFVPTPLPAEKTDATVPIAIVASIATIIVAAFAVYLIKFRKAG